MQISITRYGYTNVLFLFCFILLISGVSSRSSDREDLFAPKLVHLSQSTSFWNGVIADTLDMAYEQDKHFMSIALRQARIAFNDNEVPIGAVVVDGQGNILSAARNSVESMNDATAQAEILAMRRASEVSKNWQLFNCTLYTTLEPCAMGLGAAQLARVKRIVYGASDDRLGACALADLWIELAKEREKEKQTTTKVKVSINVNTNTDTDIHADTEVSKTASTSKNTSTNPGLDDVEDDIDIDIDTEPSPPYHQIEVQGGVFGYESAELVIKFFNKRGGDNNGSGNGKNKSKVNVDIAGFYQRGAGLSLANYPSPNPELA